jgi:hypothetical protein
MFLIKTVVKLILIIREVPIMKKIIIAVAALFCCLFLAISCFALTPDQVIKLKKAGVSDETIQMMIKQEAAKDSGKDPYATMGTKEVTDKDGNTVTIYTTGNNSATAADAEEAKNVEKAWEMLRSMTIKKQ